MEDALVSLDFRDFRVAPNDRQLSRSVESIARNKGRPARPLKLQALLELPRLAGTSGLVDRKAAVSVIEQLAEELPLASFWQVDEAEHFESPRSLRFEEIDTGDAIQIMGTFHYLKSP